METTIETCFCGQPLHYQDKQAEAYVKEMIERFGPDVQISIGGRAWRVQRHYIALHGLKAYELPGLGFPEIK